MRWFKHMTATMSDERIAAYVADAGLEGYGFYWALLEVVAGQLGKDTTEATVTYPLTRWSRLLYSHHHRVGKYLGKLQGNGLVTVEYLGSDVKVTIPKLLKYRDEYSTKSRHSPDKLPPKIQRQIQSIDTETELKDICAKPARKAGAFVSTAQATAFAEFWSEYPLKKAKPDAQKAYVKAIVKTGQHRAVMAGLRAQLPELLAREPSHRPYPATWLNGKRWEDEIDSPEQSEDARLDRELKLMGLQ